MNLYHIISCIIYILQLLALVLKKNRNIVVHFTYVILWHVFDKAASLSCMVCL